MKKGKRNYEAARQRPWQNLIELSNREGNRREGEVLEFQTKRRKNGLYTPSSNYHIAPQQKDHGRSSRAPHQN